MRDFVLPISMGLGIALGVVFLNIPLGLDIGTAVGFIMKDK